MAIHSWATIVLLAVSQALAQTICQDVPGPNQLQNPGFDAGEVGWTTGTASIKTGIQEDGTLGPYISVPGSTASRIVSQTITGLSAGTRYTTSLNYQGYLPSTAAVSVVNCNVRINLVDGSATTILISSALTITKADPQPWLPLSSSFTPSSSEVTWQFVAVCSASVTIGSRVYMDNATVMGPPVQSCSTIAPTSMIPSSSSASDSTSALDSSTTPDSTSPSSPTSTPDSTSTTSSVPALDSSTTPGSMSISTSTPDSSTALTSVSSTTPATPTTPISFETPSSSNSDSNTMSPSSPSTSPILTTPLPSATKKPCRKRTTAATQVSTA